MKIHSFIKRLNAVESGYGNTNDNYIAVPSGVSLASMFNTEGEFNAKDKHTGQGILLKYASTYKNNQIRITKIGNYCRRNNILPGDEILIEKIEKSEDDKAYYIDYRKRKVAIFQVNRIERSKYIEIFRENEIADFKEEGGNDFLFPSVNYDKSKHVLKLRYVFEAKKKRTSPDKTRFFDLLIDDVSILDDYAYQDYIELNLEKMKLSKMQAFWISTLEIKERDDE